MARSETSGIIAQIPEEKKFAKTKYQFLLAKSQARLGHIKIAVATLEQARLETDLIYNPRLHIKILEQLRSLYSEQDEYRKAFDIKQAKLSVEQQYRLRAFIGSGRLKSEKKIIYSDSRNPQIIEDMPREITASSRRENVDQLVERIIRPQDKLTVIYGQPGVGKTWINVWKFLMI